MYRSEILYKTCTDGLFYCVFKYPVQLYLHSLVLACPITEELQFTCFALIGPLVIPISSPDLNYSILTVALLPSRTGRGKKHLQYILYSRYT